MMPQKPVFLEDTIMRKGEFATAGSKILDGFKAPFDAAVVERLQQKGFTLQSVAPAMEFGLVNPDEPYRSTAVDAVASGQCDLALCNDPLGQVRRLSSDSNLYYIHPTYGSVSRYGLIPAVSSMDTVGIVCRDLAEGMSLLSVIAGYDSRDGVSLPDSDGEEKPHESAVKSLLLSEKTLPLLSVLPETATILAAAELTCNINRYDGLKFGRRTPEFRSVEDLYLKTRTEGFTLPTKLSLVIGSMVLSEAHYDTRYHKAMQIRRALRDAVEKLLEIYDVLTAPLDLHGVELLAPLCGLPSLGLPSGQILTAARRNENVLFAAAEGRVSE